MSVLDLYPIHIVLTNYATDKLENVMAWISRKKCIILQFIPTTTSWVNLLERFFATLTQKQIRRGVFPSVPQLKRCFREYLHGYQGNPRPLIWTKTVDEMVGKFRLLRAALPELS